MADLMSEWSTKETLRLANEHALAGRVDEALAMLEEVAASGRGGAEVLFALGSAALQLGQPQRAAKHLRKAIERNRNIADYHVFLAPALARLGEHDEAMADQWRDIRALEEIAA
jgi:Flp pilus assembly protein TadD